VRPKRRDRVEIPVPLDVLVALGAKRRTDRWDGVSLDVLVARLATRQEGVVATDQLLALGLTRAAIKHRMRVGRLIRVHQGVYAVGHEALGDRGRAVAALLAAGPGAALSHRAAAAVYGLIPSMPQLVDITLTSRRPRMRPGLKIHQTENTDTRRHEGLKSTTPVQTLRDLEHDPDHDRLCTEALYRQLVTTGQLEAATLLDPLDGAPTRSALERRFRALVESAGLPRPKVNHRIGPDTVDFAWPAHKLVVETDGWDGHGNRLAIERDHARDAMLQALGYRVLRFTWRQVFDEPLLVAARIAPLLVTA
jgi:very-short-patch-repair endonuclease